MGIDHHGALALKYFGSRKEFGEVLMIGRQAIHISRKDLAKIFKLSKASLDKIYAHESQVHYESYSEELFYELGAISVDSLDASNFERASIVFDLNEKYSGVANYDTIIDFGASEHIYNVSQVFDNYSQMLKEGGSLLHVLPSNNMCGHGFYQFSPEFFFSLYSQKNGYVNTEIFMAELSNKKYWYKIKMPNFGARMLFDTKHPAYVICFTQKNRSKNVKYIQHSDYVYEWSRDRSLVASSPSGHTFKSIVKGIPILFLLLKATVFFPRLLQSEFTRVGSIRRNKRNMAVKINSLIDEPT